MIESEREYKRLKGLLSDMDEKQQAVLDGVCREAAEIRAQLSALNETAKKSGLVMVDKTNPTRQKELPVSRALTKLRASYNACINILSNALGKQVPEDEDDSFEEEYG